MESKAKTKLLENKWFVVFYLIWLFIHIILFLNGKAENDDCGFWPFDDCYRSSAYGFIEFFVYLTLPLLYFAIKKLIGDDIKKSLGENN